MKRIFFTPGPSQLYPTVAKHIINALAEDIPSISHRGEKFHEIFRSTQEALRKLLKIPKNHKIFFLSSGTEAMERIIENTVEEYSLHFVNGAFSKKFYQTAVELGKKPVKIEAKPGDGFNFESVKIPNKVELLCFTHNETSTGVALPVDDIYRIKKRYKNKLMAVDTVSSAPFIDIDYKLVDLVFFSVQKGFGLPAGLGVVIVSPKAIEKYKFLKQKKARVGSYHSFDSLLKYADKFETPETPNVLAIYLLGKVCQDMVGSARHRLVEIRRETEEKADLLYNFFGRRDGFSLFVKNPRYRSKTVIVIETKSDSLEIIERLKKKGLVVGSGYKDFKNKHIRIANFPAHSVDDMKRLIREIKENLQGQFKI